MSTPHEQMTTHESVAALTAYLDAHGVDHQLIEHEPTFSAASEARAASARPEQTAKIVVLEDRGAYMLALVPASDRLDLGKLRRILGASRSLRLATEREIGDHFAEFEIGAVPPVGHAMFAGEVVDRWLSEQPRVLCAAGDHRHSVLVSPKDIVRLAHAQVGDICED